MMLCTAGWYIFKLRGTQQNSELSLIHTVWPCCATCVVCDSGIFFCVPQLYLWGSPFWVRCLRMWPFFFFFLIPTIEVVIFRLRGWCMLGVFLLPAFTCLAHECQDLFESVRWNACVHRLDLGLYSHPKEFGRIESEPMLTQREKSPLPEQFSLEEDRTHDAASSRTASTPHYQRAIPASRWDLNHSLAESPTFHHHPSPFTWPSFQITFIWILELFAYQARDPTIFFVTCAMPVRWFAGPRLILVNLGHLPACQLTGGSWSAHWPIRALGQGNALCANMTPWTCTEPGSAKPAILYRTCLASCTRQIHDAACVTSHILMAYWVRALPCVFGPWGGCV